MNLGQMAHEVEWAVAGSAPVARLNKVNGDPISPLEILRSFAAELEEKEQKRHVQLRKLSAA